MKKLNLSIVLTSALFCSANAQEIAPGVYRSTDGESSISIKVNTEGNLILKAHREDAVYVNQGAGRYTDSQYPQLSIKATTTDMLVRADDNSSASMVYKMYAPANATPENGAIAFQYNDNTYYAVKDVRSLFCGMYKYLGTEPRFFEYSEGEPIILLNEDQTGKYQTHGMPSIPIRKWWIESDYKGKLQVMELEPFQRYNLVIEFGPNTSYNKEGSYTMISLDVFRDGSKVKILGEREKQLN